MSREIKFRLWDNVQKKMAFEGFHVFGEVTLFHIIDQYAYETKGNKTGLERYNDFEIMQFTGLQDKSGKDVYERDIMKHRLSKYNNENGKVIFLDGAFWLQFENNDLLEIKEAVSNYYIIGNIHENKELLK